MMTFIFPAAEARVVRIPTGKVFTVENLTLAPFAPTPGHLTFDKLEHLELQHRLVDLQHPL